MDESNTNSNLNAVQNSVIALKMTGFDAYKTEETKDFEREPISCELPNKSPQKRLKSCIEGQGTEQIVQIQHGEAAFTDTCTEVGDSAAVSFSLYPSAHELPLRPPPAIESNYTQYFAIDFLKPGHDQYIYRHANGLCVIGLASSHVALGDKPQVKAVDFNVGKSSRSDIKVTGKRKKNAHYLEANSALCKVLSNDTFYIIRCCVKGPLLEVNERLIKEPELLNTSASSEGYIAIMMPKPEDWLKAKGSFLNREQYKEQRGLC